ncbi:MAG: hypothetical protein AUG51_17585 [Acidobacteria bacterium 13_1_20CM_3_53_8]|nr:MAG: hypothetical protein AUG51_17585 [Acidobacteria bacterium 13_1_20CM_3_53_8]
MPKRPKISSQDKSYRKFLRDFSTEDLLLFGAGLVLAVMVRVSLFNFQSGDYVSHMTHWYDFIVSHGSFRALGYNFSNYTPPYLYLLALATNLPVQKLYAIKILSIIFDFPLAVFVALVVRLKYEDKLVWASAFFVTLFAPTVIFNSALWGQTDAIYTMLLLGSIYFLLKERPFASILFLSIAFSFKLQTIFLLPVFFSLTWRKRIHPKMFLLIPAVYILMILPAWMAGRPLGELLVIYMHQGDVNYQALTLNAPNFYQWLPDSSELFGKFALFFGCAMIYLFCLLAIKSEEVLTDELIIKLSLVSLILVPFFLPSMHERYFFPADVFAIVYAFYFPRYFFVPLAVILSSLLSYFPFLFGQPVIELPKVAILMGIVLTFVVTDLIRTLYPASTTEEHL